MSTNFSYQKKSVEHPDNTQIIHLKGEIDESNQSELENLLNEILEDTNVLNVVFNISALEYINSGVIGIFASFHGNFAERKKSYVFSEPNDNIYSILDLVGITSVIECFDTDEEACLSFED